MLGGRWGLIVRPCAEIIRRVGYECDSGKWRHRGDALRWCAEGTDEGCAEGSTEGRLHLMLTRFEAVNPAHSRKSPNRCPFPTGAGDKKSPHTACEFRGSSPPPVTNRPPTSFFQTFHSPPEGIAGHRPTLVHHRIPPSANPARNTLPLKPLPLQTPTNFLLQLKKKKKKSYSFTPSPLPPPLSIPLCAATVDTCLTDCDLFLLHSPQQLHPYQQTMESLQNNQD